MFRDIKVSNVKGLQECTLLNLGKINVICGKNNSGKSTTKLHIVDRVLVTLAALSSLKLTKLLVIRCL